MPPAHGSPTSFRARSEKDLSDITIVLISIDHTLSTVECHQRFGHKPAVMPMASMFRDRSCCRIPLITIRSEVTSAIARSRLPAVYTGMLSLSTEEKSRRSYDVRIAWGLSTLTIRETLLRQFQLRGTDKATWDRTCWFSLGILQCLDAAANGVTVIKVLLWNSRL